MGNGHRTVKIDTALVEAAERERGPVNRSLGGQIEHWARIGRAVENAPRMSQDKIRRALAGEITIDDFSDAESRAYFARLGQAMLSPTPAERDFYSSVATPGEAPGISEEELFGSPMHRGEEAAA